MSPELTGTAKHALIREYAELWRPSYFVETGIYEGGCAAHALADLPFLRRLIVVDYQQSNCDLARTEQVETWCGDSGRLFPYLLAGLNAPALFWLDAHALDQVGERAPPHPLLDELTAITAWEYAERSVILIDDLRLFGSLPDWPRSAEVEAALDGRWQLKRADDILRATPKGWLLEHGPDASSTTLVSSVRSASGYGLPTTGIWQR